MSIVKEKIKCNETVETLFVGVGGIGSDIVTRVANRCRGTEADNIKFVAMDTNAGDLKCVKQSKANIVVIQTSSSQTVLDSLKKDEDARKNWFPNNTTLYPKALSTGAGQVRSISRLALDTAIKTGEVQKLYKAIDNLFLKDGGELKQNLRVVVVSSASGGTGSGIAMIVGMLIREYLRTNYSEKKAIIRGYLLLPGVMDTVIRTETEKESQRRNGYATIKEINAFMIKASGFCNVRKELERYKDLHIDIPSTTEGSVRLEGLPFDFCFLLDRVDNSQESMLTLDQYKEFAAQSLYEQNIGPMEKDAFGIEDNIIKDFGEKDNFGRSRFGGIGASVLRYPYEDILEYVANSRAIDCIGSGESVGEWLKYDRAFKKELAEFRKKRAYSSDAAPKLEDVYVRSVNEGKSYFDTSIKGCIVSDVEKAEAEIMQKANAFLSAFDEQIQNSFDKDPQMKNMRIGVQNLASDRDYEHDEKLEKGKNVKEDLAKIRQYEQAVKKNAASVATSAAKTILYDAPPIYGKDLRPYQIESLRKGADGAIHPNAMRYMLYALRAKFRSAYDEVNKNIAKQLNALGRYQPNADAADYFDVRGGFTSKTEETNFDEVCDLAAQDLSFFEKIGGYKPLWEKLNEIFPAYSKAVTTYCSSVLKEASYKVAMEYLEQLCTEFENFYNSFEGKVYLLNKAQDEIVEKLKYRKGNSISYVCADEKSLKHWADLCPTSGDDLMLPAALNAKIFDAVKSNAENQRVATYDPTLAHPPVDIFDAVLVQYFQESVQTQCDEILNINILSAIAQELEFSEYFKAQELSDGDGPVFAPKVSDDTKLEYIREKIRFGNRLAAPGISGPAFCEPRDVVLCAYNKKLDDLRDLNIATLVQPFGMNATGTDTVSKYELHFFNALYNIKPDMLSRFKSPEECKEDEQYNEDAGIYYKAYHDYIKNIGPDSTKSATISTHIDKRWDSLSEMPEISMTAHYREMVKIHSALIYGIVHGMIVKQPSSRYDVQKRIYALEDTEGDRTAFVVSNNTECDEFYEVLDALYRDRASVSKIYEMQEERCKFDIDSNHRYTESAFVRDAENFVIGDGHAAPTSVFEIPLAYYNSLPRSKMDDNELSIMIDSAISVLEWEIEKYEQEVDRAPFLANRLEAQFKLFAENFQNDAYNQGDAMRKNTSISDNRVVNMVFRKVSNKLKKLNVFQFDKKIEELRALLK